jgi:hypothetical protein
MDRDVAFELGGLLAEHALGKDARWVTRNGKRVHLKRGRKKKAAALKVAKANCPGGKIRSKGKGRGKGYGKGKGPIGRMKDASAAVDVKVERIKKGLDLSGSEKQAVNWGTALNLGLIGMNLAPMISQWWGGNKAAATPAPGTPGVATPGYTAQMGNKPPVVPRTYAGNTTTYGKPTPGYAVSSSTGEALVKAAMEKLARVDYWGVNQPSGATPIDPSMIAAANPSAAGGGLNLPGVMNAMAGLGAGMGFLNPQQASMLRGGGVPSAAAAMPGGMSRNQLRMMENVVRSQGLGAAQQQFGDAINMIPQRRLQKVISAQQAAAGMKSPAAAGALGAVGTAGKGLWSRMKASPWRYAGYAALAGLAAPTIWKGLKGAYHGIFGGGEKPGTPGADKTYSADELRQFARYGINPKRYRASMDAANAMRIASEFRRTQMQNWMNAARAGMMTGTLR